MKEKSIPGDPAVPSKNAYSFPEWLSACPDIHLQIRRLRRSKGVSQANLAEHTGLTWRSIPNIESGKVNPKISTLKKIAEFLDCELKILLVPRNVRDGAQDHASEDLRKPPSGPGENPGPKSHVLETPEHEAETVPEKKKEYFWD